MKFTKTDNIRIFVSKYKEAEKRGDLYKTQQVKRHENETLEQQVMSRVNQANKLYNVFFPQNHPRDLESHFNELVSRVRKANRTGVEEILYDYTGYSDNRGRRHDVSRFSYPVPEGKNLRTIMATYVQENMEDLWQKTPYKKAAVEVLLCICDGKGYRNSIKRLSKDTIRNFNEACRACQTGINNQPQVFVPKTVPGIQGVSFKDNTLEGYFSALIQFMAKRCQKDIVLWQEGKEEREDVLEEGIKTLANCKFLVVKGKNRGETVKVNLDRIHYKWATTDRLRAILLRMRRPLKRGSNGEIAIILMQGLAQVDGKTFSSVIYEMRKNPEQGRQLKKFVDAVIRNYYHTDAVKSIRQTDVKIQPSNREDRDTLLALSNESNTQKAALNETLIRYAASQKDSDQILLDLKKLLFYYFSIEDKAPGKIWAFPPKYEGYFDDMLEDSEKQRSDQADGPTLAELWEDPKPCLSEIKERIKYINYGRYLQCLAQADSDFEKYWLKYIKEYIEKNYTGDRKIERDSCFATSMLSACWKDIIRFLCGKYIDLGKAVYHFAMPEDLTNTGEFTCGQIREDFKQGISSFDYETIKAEETLQRDISIIMVGAESSFAASVIDEKKRAECIEKESKRSRGEAKNLEDIFFVDAPAEGDNNFDGTVLWDMTKSDARTQLLRFYGGASTIKGIDWDEKNADREFIRELLSHLKKIRNENFHYVAGKEKKIETKYTSRLWENDQRAYSDLVKTRYYSNNTGMFYKTDDICTLVSGLYAKNGTAEAQIPAFRKIWQRKDLSREISSALTQGPCAAGFQAVKQDSQKQLVFGNALYFLLKEIYYRDFILNKKAKEYFFEAAEEYYNENHNDEKNGRAVQNFNEYIKSLKGMENSLTFGGICQAVLQEYSQQNTRKGETEIFKHYKMLFPIYVKKAFEKFVGDGYDFLKKPFYRELSGEPDFLDSVSINCMEFPEESNQFAAWYTFAHFIYPKQLNFLIGDFKSYIQYRQDIARRMDFAGEIRDRGDKLKDELQDKIQNAQSVLSVLEFVRLTAGRVSDCFRDYYSDENAYADYLSQYVSFDRQTSEDSYSSLQMFCRETLKDGKIIDVYADEKNPKILRNIEMARMFGGGDLPLQGRKPVSAKEIQKYYADRERTNALLNQGLCKDEKEQKEIVQQQKAGERITLNDVTDIYAIINDLLGQLISFSYLRERDQMYLFLGFYYMALMSPDGWEGENLQTAESSSCKIDYGLVLYQTVGVYDYGLPLLYQRENGKWGMNGGSLSGKYMTFYKMHSKSMECALRLFGEDKRMDDAIVLRNYVDHGKYFVDHEKSIVELYNEFYNLFFGYSHKLRNSVVYNFKSVLERYFVEPKLQYKKETAEFELEKLDSTMFTYKLQSDKTCKMKAKDEEFLIELKDVLEYASR